MLHVLLSVQRAPRTRAVRAAPTAFAAAPAPAVVFSLRCANTSVRVPLFTRSAANTAQSGLDRCPLGPATRILSEYGYGPACSMCGSWLLSSTTISQPRRSSAASRGTKPRLGRKAEPAAAVLEYVARALGCVMRRWKRHNVHIPDPEALTAVAICSDGRRTPDSFPRKPRLCREWQTPAPSLF